MSAKSNSNSKANSKDSVLESVPRSWPGAFGAYKYSRQNVMLNLGTIVILFLIPYVAQSFLSLFMQPSNSVTWNDFFSPTSTLVNILGFLISALFYAALILVYFNGVNNKKIDFVNALKQIWPKYIDYLLVSIIAYVLIALSILAFVIPFFFVFPRLFLAPYFLIDKDLGPIEAIKASWNNTSGYSMKVWGLIGVGILMFLPVITIIGIPFSIYFLVMYSASPVILYKYITTSSK